MFARSGDVDACFARYGRLSPYVQLPSATYSPPPEYSIFSMRSVRDGRFVSVTTRAPHRNYSGDEATASPTPQVSSELGRGTAASPASFKTAGHAVRPPRVEVRMRRGAVPRQRRAVALRRGGRRLSSQQSRASRPKRRPAALGRLRSSAARLSPSGGDPQASDGLPIGVALRGTASGTESLGSVGGLAPGVSTRPIWGSPTSGPWSVVSPRATPYVVQRPHSQRPLVTNGVLR